MSSFFDDASLVVIPSGYKDGKVYSVKPTSGAGDLTFTRNSNATRVDANGLVEKVRTNITLYSNDFSNWIANNTTITSDSIIGPFGTDNADLMTVQSTIDEHNVYYTPARTTSANNTYTHSFYVKKGTGRYMAAWMYFSSNLGGPYATYDLDTNTLVASGTTAAGTTYIDSAIEVLTNGWVRISVSGVSSLSTSMIPAIDARTSGSLVPQAYYLGAGETYYIYGAQLEQGSVATSYIETTTTAMSEFAGVTASSVADVPRLDYSGGSCPSLLLEPQRTNNITSSENISTGWTYTNTAVSINQTTSPDGYANADAIVPDTTSGQHAINSSNISSSGSFTLSAFVKAGELNKVAIRESNATGAYASFDLSTGTKIEDNVSGDAFIESFSNGWYRIGVTYTYSGNIRLGINVLSNAYTTGNPSSGATYWSSNGTDKLYVYGMQCEAGRYPTSYIPTYGTTVTRLADACSKTGISSLIGQTEGVLFVDFVPNNTPASGVQQWLMFLGSGSAYIAIFISSGQKLRANVANTTDQAVIDTSFNLVAGTRYKAALAYKANDFAFYVNGVQIGVDTSGTVPAVSTLQNNYNTTAANSSNAGLNQALLFKTRLSNADLANLTTL